MKKFELLSHIADLKIKAFGKTKKELFLNILKGMSENQKPEVKNGKIMERNINVNSLNLKNLLVDFLNEVLYLTQINNEVYYNIKIEEFTVTSLKGKLIGQKVERFGEDIKAATYHELDILKNKNNDWEATVLFDI